MQSVTVPALGTLHAINSLFVLVAVCGVVLIAVHFQHPVIRASTPDFMLSMTAGAALLHVAVYLLLIDPPTDVSCEALLWTGHTGFALLFGSISIKTWRLVRTRALLSFSFFFQIKIVNSRVVCCV